MKLPIALSILLLGAANAEPHLRLNDENQAKITLRAQTPSCTPGGHDMYETGMGKLDCCSGFFEVKNTEGKYYCECTQEGGDMYDNDSETTLKLGCCSGLAEQETSDYRYVCKSITHSMLDDAFVFFHHFYDRSSGHPAEGLWFDSVSLSADFPPGALYSAASLGFGLVIDCILAEITTCYPDALDYKLSRSDALSRAKKSLQLFADHWPKDSSTGFRSHWVNANMEKKGEFSTIDTAIAVLGALFAWEYYRRTSDGTQIDYLVFNIITSIEWDAAIDSNHGLAMTFDNGPSGYTKPWNEYYMLSLVAAVYGRQKSSQTFFETYFSSTGGNRAVGGTLDGSHFPKNVKFGSSTVLVSDNTGVDAIQSSFVPLFCFFFSHHFQTLPWYKTMLQEYLKNDASFWHSYLQYGQDHKDSTFVGNPIDLGYKVFGSGAGPNHGGGYGAQRVNNDLQAEFNNGQTGTNPNLNPYLVFEWSIMAGYLVVDDQALQDRFQILSKLQAAYMNDSGLFDGGSYGIFDFTWSRGQKQGRVMWRGSGRDKTWDIGSATSIDYAPFILGLSTELLGKDWFGKYALMYGEYTRHEDGDGVDGNVGV